MAMNKKKKMSKKMSYKMGEKMESKSEKMMEMKKGSPPPHFPNS